MLKRFFICFIAVSLCLGFSACKMGAGDDDMGGGLVNPNGDPSITVTGITFGGNMTLRPNKTYDPRDFLDTVPSGGVLPSGITFDVNRDTPGNPMSFCASIRSGKLVTTSVDNPSYTLTATYNGTPETCKFWIKAPDPSHGSSDINPTAASGKTYATVNRILNDSSSPWYAICFISDKQVRIGICSVRRENAIKLARGANPGTGSSHILNYTYDGRVYDLQGYIRVVGGECVIKNGVLTNYFFETAPKEFKYEL